MRRSILALPVVVPPGPEYEVRDKLVSWWGMDEAAGDATRDDSHGTNILTRSGSLSAPAGKYGLCYWGQAHLYGASNLALRFPTGDFEVCAWVRRSSTSTDKGIISRYGSASTKEWSLLLEGGNAKFAVSVDGSAFTIANAGALPDTTTLHFLNGWRDTGASTIGVQINNGTPATAAFAGGNVIYTGTSIVEIGTLYGGGVYSDDGYIDEGCVFNGKLSTEARDWLYNAGAGRAYSEVPP